VIRVGLAKKNQGTVPYCKTAGSDHDHDHTIIIVSIIQYITLFPSFSAFFKAVNQVSNPQQSPAERRGHAGRGSPLPLLQSPPQWTQPATSGCVALEDTTVV
jgi:hypothetical protein